MTGLRCLSFLICIGCCALTAGGCTNTPATSADGASQWDSQIVSRDGSVSRDGNASRDRNASRDVSDGPRSIDGATTPCHASGSIDPQGGTITGCGARLTAKAGTVTASSTIEIDRQPAQGALPFEFAFASAAYSFTPTTLKLALPVEITLPHASGTARTYPAYLDASTQGWAVIEACKVTATEVTFWTAALDTYALVYDTVKFPPSTKGLGSGTIAATFDGQSLAFDLSAGDSTGYYEPVDAQGNRIVTLEAFIYGGPSLTHLRLDFSLDASGLKGGTTAATLTVPGSGSWFYYPFDTPAGTLTMTSASGNKLKGTFDATLHANGQSKPLSAAFDVTVGEWRFPMELNCPSP